MEVAKLGAEAGRQQFLPSVQVVASSKAPRGINYPKIKLLATALYNIGTECEYLKQYQECINAFKEALSLVENYLPIRHPLLLKFRKTLPATIRKYQKYLDWVKPERSFTNLDKTDIERNTGTFNQNTISTQKYLHFNYPKSSSRLSKESYSRSNTTWGNSQPNPESVSSGRSSR